MSTPIVEQVVEELKLLPDELQWRILEYARALAGSVPHGVPGEQLLQFSGIIPSDKLQEIDQAIEQGCEPVDVHGW